MNFRRVTSVPIELRMPFDWDRIDWLQLTYKQGSTIVAEKGLSDFTVDGSLGVAELTAEETKAFSAAKVSIQLRWHDSVDGWCASDIVNVNVGEVLHDNLPEE